MTESQNWRLQTDAGDYFLHQKKQMAVESRRPVIRRPADLVGPGIAAQAVRITSFNDELATYNGFFSAAPAADFAPSIGGPYVGYVISDAEYGGVQVFTDLSTGTVYQRRFLRAPAAPNVLTWTVWV